MSHVDPGDALLRVEDVVVQFGGVTAVNHASFVAAAGRITGLIGPNGAGKTTCFNVITGLQRPTRGTVRLQGRNVTRMAVNRRAKRGMGRTFQRLEAFGSLTVRDNVRVAHDIHAGLLGLVRPAKADVEGLLERVGIAAYADERADSVPTGTARLLELARCLAGDPKLLLLDEPSSGQDESETEAFGDLLKELAAEGRGIVMVEHDMDLVMSVCDEIHVLDFGSIIASGPPSMIRNDPAVQLAYLGYSDTELAEGELGELDAHRHPRGRDDPADPGGLGSRRWTMSIPILEVVDLHAAYGRIEVLRGVNLTVPKGAVMALLGPNGGGKSTLTKIISGQKAPTSGHIHLAGVNVRNADSEELARVGLCTIPEGRSVFPNLTVEDNLTLMSYAGVPAEAVLETAFAYFPRLLERRKQLAGTMSGGEQQMLAMSRALASDPALLLLDELSMGLAPLIVDELYETVAQIAAERRLDPVHRAVRAHRPAGLRLRGRHDRWARRRHR